MAPTPTFNAPVSGTGALTPTLPAHAQNDILVCAMATEDNVVLTPPAGWTLIPAAQQGATGIRLAAWWRRVGAGETVANPAISKASGTGAGVAVAGKITGARTSGNPWAATPTVVVNATAGTTVTIPGFTAAADALLVMIVGNSADSNTAQTSAYRATDPVQASWAEHQDASTNAATGAGIGVASATKVAAGATGNMLATLATSTQYAGIAFEVIPAPKAATGTAAVTGAGSVTAVARKGAISTAPDGGPTALVTAAGSIAAAGIKDAPGPPTVTGAGALSVTGIAEIPSPGGPAAVTAAGAVSVVGAKGAATAVTATGGTAVTATGAHGAQNTTTVTGAGAAILTGRKAATSAVPVAGGSAQTATGRKGASNSATISSTGTVTATGLRTGGGPIEKTGAASVSGAAASAVTGAKGSAGATSIGAGGSIDATGTRAVSATLALAGSAAVGAAGAKAAATVVALTGEGVLSATATGPPQPQPPAPSTPTRPGRVVQAPRGWVARSPRPGRTP